MRELVKSSHLRLKIEAFVLITYTLYHCSGLFSLISLYGDILLDDELNAKLGTPDRVIYVFGSVCQLVSIICWWGFCYRILIQYHALHKDNKWVKDNDILAKVAIYSWIVGIGFFFLGFCVLIGINDPKFIPALFYSMTMVIANKSLPVYLTYTMLYDLGHELPRLVRLKHIMKVLLIYTSIYLVCLLILFLIAWWLVIFIGLISSMFFCICCIVVPYVGCCGSDCKSFPLCCNTKAQNLRSLFLGIATFTLFICFVFNYNRCLQLNIIIEYVIGFKGADLILVFYTVLVMVELQYGPEVTPDEVRTGVSNKNSNNDPVSVTTNVEQPQQFQTIFPTNNPEPIELQTTNKPELIEPKENSPQFETIDPQPPVTSQPEPQDTNE